MLVERKVLKQFLYKDEIGSKKRKMNDGSLLVSSTIGKMHWEESGGPSYEAPSSGNSALKESKIKKSRHQMEALKKEAIGLCSTVAEYSIDGCEEQLKMNGEENKSRRVKCSVMKSPSVIDSDSTDRPEGNKNIRDIRAKAGMDVAIQNTDLKASRLIVQNMRENEEAVVSSTSGVLEEEENTREGSKKSKTMREGRNGKVKRNKSVVVINLPDVQKPTKTASETQTRKNGRTEENLVVKDSKLSVSSLADTDKQSVEKANKTKMIEKRKAKTYRTCVNVTANRLLSASLAKLKYKPTETGDEVEGACESPKKKRMLSRAGDVETVQQKNDRMIMSFWLKPANSNAGIPRPNKNLFRRKMRCPIDGCPGRSTRMNRHLLLCHPELESSEREKLLENVKENPCNFLDAVPAAPVVPVLKRKLRCPVGGCFAETTRLRRHLVYCHSELTPAERDELWNRISQNPNGYLYTLSKDSTLRNEEGYTVARPRKSSAGIPRPNFKVRSRRRKQNCPVVGCHGAAINMRRHLLDCHSDIADEHERLLGKLVEQRQEQRAAEKEALKQRSKCAVPSANTGSVPTEDEVGSSHHSE